MNITWLLIVWSKETCHFCILDSFSYYAPQPRWCFSSSKWEFELQLTSAISLHPSGRLLMRMNLVSILPLQTVHLIVQSNHQFPHTYNSCCGWSMYGVIFLTTGTRDSPFGWAGIRSWTGSGTAAAAIRYRTSRYNIFRCCCYQHCMAL